jgi:hypothetical protein
VITDARLIALRAQAARDLNRLTSGQRDILATDLLTLANIRRATTEDRHWAEALTLLGELAPTLAAQLEHLTRTADTLTPEGTNR